MTPCGPRSPFQEFSAQANATAIIGSSRWRTCSIRCRSRSAARSGPMSCFAVNLNSDPGQIVSKAVPPTSHHARHDHPARIRGRACSDQIPPAIRKQASGYRAQTIGVDTHEGPAISTCSPIRSNIMQDQITRSAAGGRAAACHADAETAGDRADGISPCRRGHRGRPSMCGAGAAGITTIYSDGLAGTSPSEPRRRPGGS